MCLRSAVCGLRSLVCGLVARVPSPRVGLFWAEQQDVELWGYTVTTTIFDADSHLMETGDWLGEYADPDVRDRLLPLSFDAAGSKAAELMAKLPGLWEEHRHQDVGADVLTGPKGWMAPGALDTDVRSRVLDALEITAQLVFPTFSLDQFAFSKDLGLRYGGTHALNRAMVAFCAPDPRLKAVGFLPLADPERAVIALEEALAGGVAAIWVPSEAPATSRRPTLTWTRSGPAWPRRVSRSCSTSEGASCFRRLSTTTACPAQRTGSVEVRISGPRTFRWCTTLPSVSWLAWLSTGFSSGIRTCTEQPSSWVPPGCRACSATSIYAHRSFSKFEPA